MLVDLVLRLRSLFRRESVERELEEELRFHFDQQVESSLRQGLTHDEAVRRARLAFGGIDQIKEEHRDARGLGFIVDLGRDVQYGARQIRRSPGFAVLAMLCLGLGIGVNTAIFSVISAVTLQPLPVADAERLVGITRDGSTGWAYAVYRDLETRSRTLSGLTLSWPMEADLDLDGNSQFVTSEAVPANYATVLGIRLSHGRWFADDGEPAAVISHAIWQRRFNLSPDVLGRRVRSHSESYTVVGVAPPEFTGVLAPLRTDLWVPIRTRPFIASRLEEGERQSGPFMLFGRLRHDASATGAAAELNAIDAQLAVEHGAPASARSPIVAEPVRGVPDVATRRQAGVFSALVAGLVGLILLIACVNVGNLLLVRGALRQREFAVRRALGASRFRLLRQLLVESLLLAIGGGVCGVVLAMWTGRLLEASLPPFLAWFEVQMDLSLDWRALVFATIASLAATIACGLFPAWRTSRTTALVAFKGEIGGGSPRRRPVGLVAQVVMSLVLLFVSGSFVQALLRLQAADPGFEVARRLYAYVFIPSPPAPADGRHDVYARALERLRALPGVANGALTSYLPLMPIGPECAAAPGGPQVTTTISAVDAGFFDTMGIDLIAGRAFTAADLATGAAAVVVSESLARRVWPNATAIGERVMVGCRTAQPAVVIGVVRDSAIRNLDEPMQPHLYRPFGPEEAGRLTAIVLETNDDPGSVVEPVRRALLGMGHDIRVYTVQPLEMHLERRYAPFRWLVSILSVFGLLALLLAGIGLYGVIAYRVTLRTQELAVRMALGATRQDIFREVVLHGLAIVLVGVAIGEVVTVALTGVAASMQEGLAPMSLSNHMAIALIWIAVALAACWLPAARAARVDPLVALRYE